MSRKIALVLLSFLVVSATANSEPLAGASYIGLCSPQFPCAAALRAYRGIDEPALGFLADSFSPSGTCECLDRFMTMGSFRYVRVHITNGTCFPERNRKCGKHDFFNGMTLRQAEGAIIARDAKLLRKFRLRLRRLKAYFGDRALVRYSPVLENPFSDRARKVLLREAAKIVSEDSLVDSTIRPTCLRNYICEVHGDQPRFPPGQRCIGDLDGISFYDSYLDGYAKKTARCEAAFFWTTSFNLLPRGYSGPFIFPSERQYQIPKGDLSNLRYCLMVSWY
jgi:hypothetical protein